MKVTFLLGDERHQYACEYLLKQGIDAFSFIDHELDDEVRQRLIDSTVIVFPLPITRDGVSINNPSGKTRILISDILELVSEKSLLVAGKIPVVIKKLFNQKKIKYIDYYDLESYQIKNALISAEGTIHYAMQQYKGGIYGTDIAILGYGRIGKILAYFLHLQGASTTVCTRKDSDLAWCNLMGIKTFKVEISEHRNNLKEIANKNDIFINTIPSNVMDEEFIKNIRNDTLIIDIASEPFGIEQNLLDKYDINYHRELGIPGRFAPKSAGEALGIEVLNIILNKEELL